MFTALRYTQNIRMISYAQVINKKNTIKNTINDQNIPNDNINLEQKIKDENENKQYKLKI